MKFTLAVGALVSIAAIGASRSTVGAQQTTTSTTTTTARTVWEGIYTEEQAKRGEPLYAKECASCHGPDLMGGEMAPGLTGGEFGANWNDLTIADLFERMRISMPQNNPGSLSRQQNADILAFLLQRGKFPAGKTELPTELEAMKQIKFLASKP